MQTNMLSYKKTKLHGMKSRRWTIKDKITQYKGLVNLYARDKKIIAVDGKSNTRKIRQEIRWLRKDIADKRMQLSNVADGDRQRLRNTLAVNQKLKMAYQNLPITEILELFKHLIFKRRKELDLIHDEMRIKMEKLINLKLEYGDLEDRIQYEIKEKTKEEDECQVISAKIQDTILKNDTAIEIQNAYHKIIKILKKDSMFFDVVLQSLQTDGYIQSKAIIKITEMGQIATEYLDNKKDECNSLEKSLKLNRSERNYDIKYLEKKIRALRENLKYLIRRDDKNLVEIDKNVPSRRTPSEQVILDDISSVSLTLNKIKEFCLVNQIDEIYPRIEDQKRQKLRLESLVAKNTRDRNTMLEKLKHAEEMYNMLCHTMASNTYWHKEKKLRVLGQMDAIVKEKSSIQELIDYRGGVYMRIRSSLQQILELLRNVTPLTQQKPPETPKKKKKKKESMAEEKKDHLKYVPPERCESDGSKLVEKIMEKIKILINQTGALPTYDIEDLGEDAVPEPVEVKVHPDAPLSFEKFVVGMIEYNHLLDTKLKDDSIILDDSFMDDPQVPNRAEIKARSAELCAENARTEFDVPIFTFKMK